MVTDFIVSRSPSYVVFKSPVFPGVTLWFCTCSYAAAAAAGRRSWPLNFQGQMWPWPLTTCMALTKDFHGHILKLLHCDWTTRTHGKNHCTMLTCCLTTHPAFYRARWLAKVMWHSFLKQMTPTPDNVDFRLQLVHCYLLFGIHNVDARIEIRCKIKANHVLLPC